MNNPGAFTVNTAMKSMSSGERGGAGLKLYTSGNFDVSEDITILLGLLFYPDNGNVSL
jgi:hypothetical protein